MGRGVGNGGRRRVVPFAAVVLGAVYDAINKAIARGGGLSMGPVVAEGC